MAGVPQADGNQGAAPVGPVAPAVPAKAAPPAVEAVPQPTIQDNTYRKAAPVARGAIPAAGLAADNQQRLRLPTRLLDSYFGNVKVQQASAEPPAAPPNVWQRLFGWMRPNQQA